MSQDPAAHRWNAVDAYFTELLAPSDDALDEALRASDVAGLPRIAVAPNQGKLLQLLAQIQGARRVLEIGTLGGYSAIWLARALPADGRLVTLEANAAYAEVARANLARAGVAEVVEVRTGTALDSLAALVDEGAEPFDLVFIDADKPNNPHYLEWALRLTRPGSLIIGDNVVREGAVADADTTDPRVRGVRDFLAMTAEHPRLSGTALQTVGSKGYDGFSLARVTS
ncbi:O-methyltransferase [Streptomyces boluensis]|uniref:Methyltransferase n=1 Tax=Streptomyces boluensis TaxID=1775135 RepID=A0A964V239_9ACTN|nr:O-methyltransferase [Streptomyces boluensis]NBE55695.1 methyltransferase [Streptomyces boluensis]